MRRFILPGLLLLALLLAACSSSGAEVPPTIHVLDTPTEDPNFGGGSDFVTNTPGGPSGDSSGDDLGDLPSETPPAAFASPTPEVPGEGGDLPAACAQPNLNPDIVAADVAALQTQLDSLVSGLRSSAATLNGWTLTDGDTSLTTQIAGSFASALPSDALPYQGPNGEQAAFVLSIVPDAALDYWRNCILSGELFVTEGGPLADGTGTLDPLDVGDGGLLLEVESPDAVSGSPDALAVRWGVSQVGNISVYYLEVPAIAGIAAPQADAVALLTAMVSAVRSQ